MSVPGPALAVAIQQLPLMLTQVPAELSDGCVAARSPKMYVAGHGNCWDRLHREGISSPSSSPFPGCSPLPCPF